MPSISDEGNMRLFVYGGLASMLAEFGTFPIDTTKTRLQIQGQKLEKKYTELRYKGMIDAFLKISKQEGLSALYSGVWPAVLRQAVYGTMKYGTYYSLKGFARDYNILIDPYTGKERVWCTVLCAATAGLLSSALANPTDVLKVRLQVHGKSHGRKSMWQCFYEIYKYEGVKGLWRGVVPTTQRAVIITSVDLPVYDFCKIRLTKLCGDQPLTHFISSFISSFGAAVTSTPMDVIRTRLMNQKLLIKAHSSMPQIVYKGTLDCAIQTVRYEGVMALYKGFIPAWMRMGPWNAIFFVIFEQLKQL